MKKCTIFMIVFIISLTIGCTKDIKDNTEYKEPTKITNTTNLIESKELNINNKMNLVSFFNGKLLYSKTIDNKDDTADERYFILNIKNNETDSVGEIKNFNLSSGDLQIVNDNEIYMYTGISKENGLISDFIKFNINDKTSTIIRSDKDITPLVYFNELNNQEILINGAILSKEGTSYDYYVDKYNHHTNTRETIIKSNYNFENKNGKLIISLSVNNNKIYAYTIKESQNRIEYSIDIYNQNGKLENSIILENFENYLKNETGDIESVLNFKSFKNYFYFGTLSGRGILFKYDKNKLIKIELEDNNYLNLIDIENGNLSDSSTDNVYFLERNKSKLFSFNLNTSKMKPLNIKTDKSYEYITNCLSDENGNLIVTASKDFDYKSDSEKYYYIAKENLK